jgi:hypothetical protein
MSLCVYALAARGARRSGVKGLAGEQLRTIPLGPVAAIVGDVTVRPRPTVANLLRYDRILAQLWAQNGALLPVRFGTILADASELDHAVMLRGATLRRRLAVVRNRAQMTVLVPIPYPNRGRAPRRRAHSGAEYLRARATARDVPQLAQLRPAIRRWVRDERMQMRGSIATVYHLVPRGAADRYRSALERAAREAGIRLRVLGPRVPYAFSDE